jgi:hypothetical protein
MDLVTYKLKVAAYVPAHLAPEAEPYIEVAPALAEYVDDKEVHLVESLYPDMAKLMNMELRRKIVAGEKQVVYVSASEILESQPAKLTRLDQSRRHRRFANLWWIDGQDGKLTLKRAAPGKQFNARSGAEEAFSFKGNPAPLLLPEDVEISGIRMEPEGGGYALDATHVDGYKEAFAPAAWNHAENIEDRTVVLTVTDPASGVRTETSERGGDKVNARARVDLSTAPDMGENKIVSITISADSFSWAGLGFLGAWHASAHRCTTIARLFTYDEWRSRDKPFAEIRGAGQSKGSYTTGATFTQTVEPGGKYVCVWSFVKPDEYVESNRNRSNMSTVCGDIVFET